MDRSESASGQACSCCARPLANRCFRFVAGDATAVKCGRCALQHGPLVRTALRTALVVGTILAIVNQGDAIIAGTLTWLGVLKILLTYTVPSCVSTNAALAVSRVDLSENTKLPGRVPE